MNRGYHYAMSGLRSDGEIHKRIVNGLKKTIGDHGPIGKELIGSAAKRIRAELKAEVKESYHDSNVCCPNFTILGCADTDEHNHLFCEYYHAINDSLLDQKQIYCFCMARFDCCSYRPNNESEGVN